MQTVVCVASGSSLTPEDVSYCRGKAKVVVVNDNWKLAPWADIHWATDGRWWAKNKEARVDGESWTMDETASTQLGLRLINGKPGFGLSLDSDFVYWGGDYPLGGNGGAQAVGLSFHAFNPERIILLGYDMAGKHWFGDHEGLSNPTDQNFDHWRIAFRTLAYELGCQGVQLVNCSRSSTLDCAPMIPLREVL